MPFPKSPGQLRGRSWGVYYCYFLIFFSALLGIELSTLVLSYIPNPVLFSLTHICVLGVSHGCQISDAEMTMPEAGGELCSQK